MCYLCPCTPVTHVSGPYRLPRARNPGLRRFDQATWMHKRRTYYVYIMSSLSRTLYTGVTNNLERPQCGCPGCPKLRRAARLKREFKTVQGYWSRKAREKGILSEEDLRRYLASPPRG